MCFAIELHTSGVYISLDLLGLFEPSITSIRARKIALHDEYAFF
jgi:hypothetical protein